MELLKFDEMKKSWHEVAKYSREEMDSDFKLEIFRKLQSIIHVGEFYYYIVNLATVEIEWICSEVNDVLGLKNKNDFDVEYIYDNIHPDDKARFIAHEKKCCNFFGNLTPNQVLNYKISYDYRLKRTDGNYIWILMQSVPIQTNDQGAVIRVLGIHTDISHLKTDNQPSGLSFLGLNGEQSFYNVSVDEFHLIPDEELFTPREKEVIKLTVEGNKSPKVADILMISVHTVHTHRKNIMKKSKCNNWIEFSSKAIVNGWV